MSITYLVLLLMSNACSSLLRTTLKNSILACSASWHLTNVKVRSSMYLHVMSYSACN